MFVAVVDVVVLVPVELSPVVDVVVLLVFVELSPVVDVVVLLFVELSPWSTWWCWCL